LVWTGVGNGFLNTFRECVSVIEVA
jgi:hypothetical protein